MRHFFLSFFGGVLVGSPVGHILAGYQLTWWHGLIWLLAGVILYFSYDNRN